MKKLFILSLLLSLCFSLFSQVYDVFSDFNKWEQQKQNFKSNPIEDALEIFEPGPLPEGDLIRTLAYSTDGSILAALYQHSDNIYFYNTTTYALLDIVDVGREPKDITMSNQSAYVCCHTSGELYIISLSDFSISDVFKVYDNPCQLEINHDETIVYVGFESSSEGSVAAYNIRTGVQIFHTFQPKISFNGRFPSLGRDSYLYYEFSLSPHSNYIIAIHSNDEAPAIFNGSTGELVKKFNFGDMRASGFSETGDTLYIVSAQHPDSLSLHRVRLNDFSVIDSIVAGSDWFIYNIYGLAINADGTKVLTAANSFSNPGYYLFDFNQHNYQFIPEESMDFTNNRIFSSNDKRYAIVRGLGMAKFIDLETGQIINRTPIGYWIGIANAISPVTDKMACGDGPFYNFKDFPDEKFYIFDFADLANIIVDTVIMSGIEPEADVTNSAVLSIDGSKLIASNMLTDNISIIDYSSGQLDTLIYMFGVSDIKTIPNTDFILAAGQDAIETKLIDLRNNKFIAELLTGYVNQMFVTANGNYAYTFGSLTTTSGKLTKISLDGASSEIVDVMSVPIRNCSRFDNKVNTKVALSPDGSYLLSGTKDDSLGEVVHIVNTQLMEVVKTIPVIGDYLGCSFGFAFTDNSKRVCALIGSQIPVIYLDGENSSIDHVVDVGDLSFSADYNPVDGLFYILLQSDWLYKVHPFYGDILGEIPTTSDDYVQVSINSDGTPLIRGFDQLLYDDVIYPLPGASQDLSFNEANNLFVIPIPGPDKICVFNPLLTDVKMFPKPINGEGVIVFPNPASEKVFINSESTIENVSIYTLSGKLILSKNCNKLNTSISVANFAEGAYLIVSRTADGFAIRKLIVVH